MTSKFLSVFFCLIVSFSLVYGEGKNILYISDNIHFSDSFDVKYTDMLQNFIDEDYGKNKINIKKISRFDINTTECFEALEMFNKQYLPEAVILMIGEANYHNLYGFSSYMKNRNKEKSKSIPIPKNLKTINEEMAEVYGLRGKSAFDEAVNAAYREILNRNTKKFKPKVIPDFYALRDNFVIDKNILSTIESYRHVWSIIRDKQFDKAKEFIGAILEKKPSQSMLYYALGSIYLMEHKESAELKALKIFEDGILVDPLNKENLCYKGLVLLFMMYKGEITSEVLYFARALNGCVADISDEISAITAINTPNYDKKIQVIDNWILYDIDAIKQICDKTKIRLIFASYPADVQINGLINKYVSKSGNMLFFDNDVNTKESVDFLIYRLARNMYTFLKNNKIIN